MAISDFGLNDHELFTTNRFRSLRFARDDGFKTDRHAALAMTAPMSF